MKRKQKVSGKSYIALAVGLLLIGGIVLLGQSETLQGRISFSPSKLSPLSQNVTRGKALNDIMIDAGYTLTECDSSSAPFPDVDESDKYCDAILTAKDEGIILGFTFGGFSPDDTVTRAEASKMAYKAYGITAYSPASATYTDVSSSDWYYVYIESLNHEGAYSVTSGTFRPADALTQIELKYWINHLP